MEVINVTEDVPGYGEEGVDGEEKGGFEDVEKRVRAIVKKRESIDIFHSTDVVLLGGRFELLRGRTSSVDKGGRKEKR